MLKLLSLILFYIPLSALPPEGFENFVIMRSTQSLSSITMNWNYPYYRAEYYNIEFLNSENKDSSIDTWGLYLSLSPDGLERDGYFYRKDFKWGQYSSISFKYLHEDWRYIVTGKESLTLAWNHYNDWNGRGLYLNFGYYHRWLKQRWNTNQYIPLTFNTEDNEGYLSFILGYKGMTIDDCFWTIDINSQNQFSNFHFSNVALDISYNILSDGILLRSYFSARTASYFVGAPAYSSFHLGIGLVF